jgi:hypothetical protein
VPRRFQLGAVSGGRARLDDEEIRGVPARFYRRTITGGSVCGLWIGGEPIYDVTVYDPDGAVVGTIAERGSPRDDLYDVLRRALVAEALRT